MIYKFKDLVDGNYCFILAKNKDIAVGLLIQLTSIPFEFIEAKKVEDIKNPFLIINNILPF
jgi:hypothetical protein